MNRNKDHKHKSNAVAFCCKYHLSRLECAYAAEEHILPRISCGLRSAELYNLGLDLGGK